MGLFNREDENFESYVARAKYQNDYFTSEYDNLNIGFYKNAFDDDRILGKILCDISQYGWQIESSLNNILEVYNNIVRKGTNDEKVLFEKIYKFFNENISSNDQNSWDLSLYIDMTAAFDKKEMVLESLLNIKSILDIDNLIVDNQKNLKQLVSYLFKARRYYIDDRALLSSFMDLLKQDGIRDYLYSDIDIKDVIEKKLKEDRKQAGIYDVDRGVLAEISQKLDILEGQSSNLSLLIDTAASATTALMAEVKDSKDEIVDLKLKSLKDLQIKANKILKDFNMKYLELLNKEKESLSLDREELFAEVEREISKRKEELNLLAAEITGTTNIQLGRVNAATRASVNKIEDFINHNDSIKQLVQDAEKNEEFKKGLQILSEQYKINMPNADAGTVQSASVGGANLIVPNIIIQNDDAPIDYTINYYFDKQIPFQQRLEHLMEEKEKEIANGAIYHERFDDIAKLFMQGQVPYMYGPSGCGKTYMIEEQLSKLFGINVVTSGYVLYEQDIIGYTNSSTGAFVPGNFYRCYKYGNVIFLDELDNGIANATVVLNRFTGKNNKSYTFPDGTTIRRHDNFRIIAAGNTNGAGRTVAHNTRQKMDESVMQRLTPVFVNYDNRVEKQILKDYPDWYYFAVNFRKSIENMSSLSGEINTIGTFTTRDAQTLKEYLDDQAFDIEKLLDFEFIQTKDADTLNSIYHYMNDLSNTEFQQNSLKILKKFNQMVEPRIQNR